MCIFPFFSNKGTKGKDPQNIMTMTMLMMKTSRDGCLIKRIPPAPTNIITTLRTMEEISVGIDMAVPLVPTTVHQMKMKSKFYIFFQYFQFIAACLELKVVEREIIFKKKDWYEYCELFIASTVLQQITKLGYDKKKNLVSLCENLF